MAPATCLATLIAACVALPIADPSTPTHRYRHLALFGVGQMAFGLVMFTAGTRLIPAAEAGLISNLEPVLAPVWVWLAFSEMPSDYTHRRPLVLGTIVDHTLIDWRQERWCRRRSSRRIGASLARQPASPDRSR